MGADLDVAARLSVDPGNSGKTITELQDNLKEAKKELKEAKIGTDEYSQALKKLEAAEGALNPAVKESSSSFSTLKSKVTDMVPALGGASSAGGAFNGVLNLIKANPIVFIIVALVAILKGLYEAFASTFEGGKKVEQVFAGIKAAGQVLMDRLVMLTGAVVKLFSGDFKGAMNDAKASVTGLGDEVSRVYSRTAELTKQLQGIKIEEGLDEVEKSRREKRLALLREQLNDEDVSVKAKKAIALELKKDVDENAKDDLDRARRKASIQKELLLQQKDGARKNADEINKIDIELANTETENALEGVRVNKQIKALNKQENAEEKAQQLKDNEEAKARKQEFLEYSNKLAKLRQDNELALLKDGADKEKKIASNKFDDDKRQTEESLRQHKITAAQANSLLLEYSKEYNLAVKNINDKFQKEETAKKVAFEKELNSILKDNRIASVEDVRKKEKLILDEELTSKLQEVLANEKYTDQQKALLAEQLRKSNEIKQKALDSKNAIEDRLKATKDKLAALKTDSDIEIARGGNKLAIQRSYLDKSRELERQDLILRKATGAELMEFDRQTTLAKINLSKAERDEKINNAVTVANTLTSLSSLVGEQTVIGKGIAAAAAIINTYQGATKALAQGGIFGYIGAAGVIASGLGSVKKIMSTEIPGQSGATISTPSAATSSPVAPPSPSNATTALDSNTIQQMGSATNRAFVVERDITNNQERIAKLNRQARIG